MLSEISFGVLVVMPFTLLLQRTFPAFIAGAFVVTPIALFAMVESYLSDVAYYLCAARHGELSEAVRRFNASALQSNN